MLDYRGGVNRSCFERCPTGGDVVVRWWGGSVVVGPINTYTERSGLGRNKVSLKPSRSHLSLIRLLKVVIPEASNTSSTFSIQS